MKSKILLLPLILLYISLLSTPVQATRPEKLVDTQVFEGPFDGGWCKAVVHGTMIVKGTTSNGELTLYNVKVTMLQKFILYASEGGEIVAVVKVQLQYVGTVTTLEGGPDPTEAFYTGKMVADVVINEIKEGWLPPEKPDNSHWVVWYEEGASVREIGFGEPFFF